MESEIDNKELVLVSLDEALVSLREGKPNDRSEKDRAYAVCVTELEKLIAIVKGML